MSKTKNIISSQWPSRTELINALASMDDEHQLYLQAATPLNFLDLHAEDHLVIASLRRSIDNIHGFLAMADQRNKYCGMPIVRFQLDTAMCLLARTFVNDITKYVQHIAEGNKRSDFMGKYNKKLSDEYLHKALSKKHPNSSDLYKQASAYIHFSTCHLHGVIDLTGIPRLKALDTITAGWEEEEIKEAFVCFLWATEAILAECKEWQKTRGT